MHQVQDSFSKLSLDGDGVITNIAWHVKSIMQDPRNQGAGGAIAPSPTHLDFGVFRSKITYWNYGYYEDNSCISRRIGQK